MRETQARGRRNGCLGCAGLALSILGVAAWLSLHGIWREHADARSPDGRWVAESRILSRWGPMYSWWHFHVRVRPPAPIRCTRIERRWRGTPADMSTWQHEHRYATYNTFDDPSRLPGGLRWISATEFVVEGGEGNGAVFEVGR